MPLANAIAAKVNLWRRNPVRIHSETINIARPLGVHMILRASDGQEAGRGKQQAPESPVPHLPGSHS